MCDHTICKVSPGEHLCRSYDVQCVPVLGQGAYATVVKAVHRQENKCYALKIFSRERLRKVLQVARICGPPVPSVDSVIPAHLRREVQILQGLRHRYVCGIKEAIFDGHSVGIVLELAQGGDLMSYTEQRASGVLLEPEGQYFAYQICEALKYIHSKGVAHWDLKPQNVLLTGDTPPMVLLADCGVRKVIDYMSELQTRCSSGLPFIRSEVLSDSIQEFDKLVDSWSLGVMIIQLLCKTTSVYLEASDEPDWDLLEDYNISDTGVNFIALLLPLNPCSRMTPTQALLHPWLADQGARQRARLLELDEVFRRDEIRCPSSPSAENPTGNAQTKKRKASCPHLEESWGTMYGAHEDTEGAKRPRGDQATVQRERANPTPSVPYWPSFDINHDEVPGLGLFHA